MTGASSGDEGRAEGVSPRAGDSRGVPGGRPPGLAFPGWLPLREDLAGHVPYGAPQIDVPVRLNTNENPYPPSPALVQAIATAVAEVAGTLNRYPDRDAVALREDLAGYLGHGLAASQVWAANGSNEIIQQLLQAFGGPGRSALGFEPSYSMHPLIALATGTGWISGARDADFGVDPDRAVALIRAAAACRGVLHLAEQPDRDRAGPGRDRGGLRRGPRDDHRGRGLRRVRPGHFGQRADPAAALPPAGRNPHHVQGVRAGRGPGRLPGRRPRGTRALLLVRLPYHLSAVTQAVAQAALAHRHEPMATVAALRAERDDIVRWLRGRGLRVADSDANFVLFGEFADRHAVWQGLLDQGVLIRETGPAGWLRVSVGTPAEMAAFRAALDHVVPGTPDEAVPLREEVAP